MSVDNDESALRSLETEAERVVRALRKRVYGADCSDLGWRATRQNWMKPENIDWLKEKAERVLA